MAYYEEVNQKTNYYKTKVLGDIYKGVSDQGLQLIKLTEVIPNWETYLTAKQLEATQIYIKCLNASEVDYQLNLSTGTAHQRLFGSSTSKGAIGKLKVVAQRLEEQGYFERQRRIKQDKNSKRKTRRSNRTNLSQKTKDDIRELFKLVVEMPDYEQYLTKSQKERIYQFMRLRSISKCAKYFGITKNTFKQSLLGRSGNDGILGRLRKASSETTVDDWNDI